MCTELGKDLYMTAFVEEAGGANLCDVKTGDGCNAKELAYIKKRKPKSGEDNVKSLERLNGMENDDMNAELKGWLKTRQKNSEAIRFVA